MKLKLLWWKWQYGLPSIAIDVNIIRHLLVGWLVVTAITINNHNLASVRAQNLYFLKTPSEVLVFVWISLRIMLSLTKFEVIKRWPWLLVTDNSNPINFMSNKVIYIVTFFCIFRKSLPMHLRSSMTADGTPLWRPHKLMSHCCFKLMTVTNSGDYFNYLLCDK